MVPTRWQKLFSQGQSRPHRGSHWARVQQRLMHKRVSATTWESSDLRFDDKCNHLGVTP